jgi:hypothetical protein
VAGAEGGEGAAGETDGAVAGAAADCGPGWGEAARAGTCVGWGAGADVVVLRTAASVVAGDGTAGCGCGRMTGGVPVLGDGAGVAICGSGWPAGGGVCGSVAVGSGVGVGAGVVVGAGGGAWVVVGRGWAGWDVGGGASSAVSGSVSGASAVVTIGGVGGGCSSVAVTTVPGASDVGCGGCGEVWRAPVTTAGSGVSASGEAGAVSGGRAVVWVVASAGGGVGWGAVAICCAGVTGGDGATALMSPGAGGPRSRRPGPHRRSGTW